ncbi:MAG: acyl-CoA/acyl-ACP dehydrogenase [Chloroflexi bacterium]|nr:acyl-CoA/acyl-ACP dehydrogenase [Chloroflexota bacterium]
MDLSLTEDQEMLRSTAREFMERECSKERLLELERDASGIAEETWRKAAEIGWTGMLVPEEYGGVGSSMTDAAVVFEQLGRGPLSGPLFSSCALGALIVLESGDGEQKRRYLPGIASGREIVTLALTEADYGWGAESVQMRAERKGNGFVLDGVKLFVQDAMPATRLIVAARMGDGASEDGVTLFMVDATAKGVSRRLLSGFINWSAEVRFDSVEVSFQDVLGEVNQGWMPLQRALQKAIPVLCAYKVGGSQAVADMSLDYSRTREQFGQPIGRFQRVQDHIISVVNHLDAARWTTYEALWKLDTGRDAETSVHLAKAVASEAYYQACNGAHEVHAGVGVSREYGLTLHTKMSRTLYSYLGDPAYHRRRLATALRL